MDKVNATEMNLPPFTDAELMEGVVNNDRKAFRDLYERYQEDMYRLALRKLHSEEIAEEIVQDVFVGLWEKRHRLVIAGIRNYLFRSVKNAVLDHIRAQIVRQNYAKENAFLADPASNYTDDVMALYELMAAIYAGMDNLPEKTREIFRFNRLE
jgi:RNA polymerase sigma factor (sigma-70 family)